MYFDCFLRNKYKILEILKLLFTPKNTCQLAHSNETYNVSKQLLYFKIYQ